MFRVYCHVRTLGYPLYSDMSTFKIMNFGFSFFMCWRNSDSCAGEINISPPSYSNFKRFSAFAGDPMIE